MFSSLLLINLVDTTTIVMSSNLIAANSSYIEGIIIDRSVKKMKQAFSSVLSNNKVNITVDQWVIMESMYQQGKISQKELAEKTSKDKASLTRMIDLLVNKKILTRKVDTSDRRRQVIILTSKGRKIVLSLEKDIRQLRKKIFKGIGKQELKALEETMNTIYKNII